MSQIKVTMGTRRHCEYCNSIEIDTFTYCRNHLEPQINKFKGCGKRYYICLTCKKNRNTLTCLECGRDIKIEICIKN